MSSYIPPELTDQIIDHFHNDSKALNACAPTSRDWLPSTRHHRFRSIRFHSAKKIDALHQLSQVAPDLLPYYQEAVICDNSGYIPASILEAAASACLILPNLACIKFNNRIYASTPRVVTILSPIVSKITTLNLSGTLFPSSNDFWPLICSFPSLNTVQACGVTFGSTEETAFSPVNTYEPPITTFSVSTSRQGFVIDHLINSPFPLRFLKIFEILYIDPSQTTFALLAESIQGTFKQLRFSAVSIHRADDQSDGPMESLPWIPLVLRGVTPSIRKICVELVIKNIDHHDSMDWSQSGVSVTVISTSAIRGIIDTEALKAFVARRLPMTSQRGILRCTVGKS
ncbi:hypothetical protein BDM02DRAFT_3119280 [Thelephora ganbajun]|uniref:Uncharacterized protein n=1 Tax=Thelephora ganbajun TaxID=370292 RepID=A0ACB6Z983_THEGA|nr:hypothetical protein BDM02DRAFT_3119280 [Thelephora ganbajun]